MNIKYIEDTIGNTPIVRLKHIPTNPNVEIYCKLEGNNPGGSVKDRAAYGMIKSALDRGNINQGDNLVEATSGNTGIALAMIAKVLGVAMTLIMPDNATRERVLSMKAYGAEVILTPSKQTIEYARQLADEMEAGGNYKQLNQFANPDNYRMHEQTTGPEIWRDTDGQVTHFVSSMGTTGTIMGVSRYLKSKNPSIQIIGAQPTEGSEIPGIRRWSPEYLPKIYEPSRVDKIMDVSREQATKMTRRLAKEEGILAGMSSGGALSIAIQLAENLESGLIVCITCDRGDRYLSSDLFED